MRLFCVCVVLCVGREALRRADPSFKLEKAVEPLMNEITIHKISYKHFLLGRVLRYTTVGCKTTSTLQP
jgi:hypothetical protein